MLHCALGDVQHFGLAGREDVLAARRERARQDLSRDIATLAVVRSEAICDFVFSEKEKRSGRQSRSKYNGTVIQYAKTPSSAQERRKTEGTAWKQL